jgi:hypothetical protein
MEDRSGPPEALHDRRLVDRAGAKIGRIAEIYVDPRTHRPEWVLVHIGLFGTRPTLVPIRDASPWGSEISVPYAKSVVEDAPTLNPGAALSLDAAVAMSAHYGISEKNERDGREING